MASSDDNSSSDVSSPYHSEGEVPTSRVKKYDTTSSSDDAEEDQKDMMSRCPECFLPETERDNISQLLLANDPSKGAIFPESVAEFITDELPTVFKRLKDITETKPIMIFMTNRMIKLVSSFPNHVFSKSVLLDFCFFSNDSPLLLLTLMNRNGKREHALDYNANLARVMISAVRRDISEHFTLMHGVITEDDFTSSELFFEVIEKIEKAARKMSLPGSLDMSTYLMTQILNWFLKMVPKQSKDVHKEEQTKEKKLWIEQKSQSETDTGRSFKTDFDQQELKGDAAVDTKKSDSVKQYVDITVVPEDQTLVTTTGEPEHIDLNTDKIYSLAETLTSQKLKEHFLTCAVCVELFNDPCTLECQHTFCRKCVIRFTKTQPEALMAKSVPCPCCRKLTSVTNHQGSVEEWVGQMKPSFLIQGLMDSFGPDSKEIVHCSYCREEGETTAAVAWCSVCNVALCERCHRMHKRIPATKQHNVAYLTGEEKGIRRTRLTCHEHQNEILEFLCKDCNKPVCHKCCIIYHRKCNVVVTLDSELPAIKSSLIETMGLLKEDLKKKEKRVCNQKATFEILNRTKTKVKEEIQLSSQDVKDRINRKEEGLTGDLKAAMATQMLQAVEQMTKAQKALDMNQQLLQNIDHTLSSDREVDITELYALVDSSTEERDDLDLEVKVVNKVSRIDVMSNIKSEIGGIRLGGVAFLHPKPSLFPQDSYFVLQDEICDFRLNQQYSSDPVDMKILKVGGTDVLVIVDCVNACIKSFCKVSSWQFCSILNLQCHLSRMEDIGNNTVAVTAHRGSEGIFIIKVNPELKCVSLVQTRKEYRGMTLLTPSTLAVGCMTDASIDIIDMKGNKLSCVTSEENGLVTEPRYLCTSSDGNILASDAGTKSVVCLTPQGDVVFRYVGQGDGALIGPRGVICTSAGDILVVDWTAHKVIQLTETGEFVRVLLTESDGLFQPYGILFDEIGQLFVTKLGTGVQVFKLM